MPKRRAEQSAPKAAKRMKQDLEQDPFPLFNLPAELRNLVYEKAAETQTAYLVKGKVSDNSGFLTASSKLHDEYLPILLVFAPKFKARVLNFDFRDVIYTLNRLSDKTLDSLSTTSTPRARQLHIDIEINNTANANTHLLHRWLNRATRKANKGTELDISYSLEATFDQTAKETRWYNSDAYFLDQWVKALDGFIHFAKEGKAKNEAEKIRAHVEGLI